MKVEHFRIALTSAAEFENAYEMLQQHAVDFHSDQESTRQSDHTLLDLHSKRQVLLSLEFEAAMRQHLNVPRSTTPMNPDPNCLSTIISRAQRLSAPRKTYALFADIVLSSTYPQAQLNEPNSHPSCLRNALPLPTAATLIEQIIKSARTLPDYDTVRASRWIRCLIQLCLDQHQSENLNGGNHHDQAAEAGPPLQTVEDIASQAITLARQSLQDRTQSQCSRIDCVGENAPAPTAILLYPAEELEWLSTTLFNLGIDFYVIRDHDAFDNNPIRDSKGNDTGAEAETQAKKWTNLAVTIADVLAEYQREEGGDGGLLSSVLRRKIREGLGWGI